METRNLQDAEFRALGIRMLNDQWDLQQRDKKHKIEIENVKKSEMKNTLKGINTRVDEAKDRIRDLEDRVAETPTQNRKKKKESKK